MAWIELHQTLPRHPKLIRLANRLRVPRAQAAGHLTFLWLWTLDYAPTGDLSAFGPAEISAAADFGGDAELFANALSETGWIEPDGRIHDWHDYAGRIISMRDANRDRMREARERKRATHVQRTTEAQPEHVQDVCGERAPHVRGLPNPTQPNQGEAHQRAREREGPWPTEAEVLNVAAMRGIPAECASKWWLEHDARGGLDARGQPIARWESSLQAYAVTWRANEQRDRQRAASNGRPRGRPEPRQIQEHIELPILNPQ